MKRSWIMPLLKGVVLLVLGMLILLNPIGTIKAIAFYIGLILLVAGMVLAVNAILTRKTSERWQWGLVEGVMDALFGIVLMSNPEFIASVVTMVLGIWIMMFGMIKVFEAFRLKKMGLESWWIKLLVAIFNVFVGYMIASNLSIGAFAMTVWLGIGLIVFGTVNIFVALNLRKLEE
ncbi:MAG: DUF308 domain-containing protein [Reichenbachiella sp.]